MSWEVANPFIKADGSVVMSPAEWPEQSAYLKEILAEDLYGRMPSAPGNVQAEKGFTKELWDGTAVFEVYDLSFGPENKVHEDVAVIRACGGDGAAKPVPIVLCGGYVDEAIAKYAVSQGFCIATPLVDDAAPDEPDEPVIPDKPSKPTKPSNGSTPNTAATKPAAVSAKGPKTGDDCNVLLYGGIFALAAAGVAVIIWRRRRAAK